MNVFCVTGRLTKDPELKELTNDKKVVSFTIANDVGFGDNKKTNFFNCVAWNKRAELISNYTTKGILVAITGQVVNRTYDDKDGVKKYVTEILVNEIVFCDKKKNTIEQYLQDGEDDLPFR